MPTPLEDVATRPPAFLEPPVWPVRIEPGTDLGTVAIVHPRVSVGVARALRRCGFCLLSDTGSRQVWVRHPGQPDPEAA